MSSKAINFSVYLDADAMFYTAACKALSEARKLWPKAEQELQEHKELQAQLDTIKAANGGLIPEDSYEAERLCLALEDANFRAGQAFAPMMESLAIAHLMSAAALESHINTVAEDRLKKQEYDAYDKMSLVGKWLFLPQFLGVKILESGEQPFQDFDQLVKFRNALTHYHTKREKWDQQPTPQFLGKLGLTLPQAERSVAVAQSMVLTLSKKLLYDLPFGWSLGSGWSYFALMIDRR